MTILVASCDHVPISPIKLSPARRGLRSILTLLLTLPWLLPAYAAVEVYDYPDQIRKGNGGYLHQGNVYLTGRPGVTVFNRAGEKIETIPIDSGWTANVCFGGRDRDILFITAKESVYTPKMRVKGVR